MNELKRPGHVLRPVDKDDVVWCATSHLALCEAEFLAAFADKIPRRNDLRSWIVQTNPLLQLRSVIVDYESEWGQFECFREMQCLFRGHEKRITNRGRFDSGIYSAERLKSTVWEELRVLAQSLYAESGLPKLPDLNHLSYFAYADWSEREDEVLEVLHRGGDPDSLSWVRMKNSELWVQR